MFADGRWHLADTQPLRWLKATLVISFFNQAWWKGVSPTMPPCLVYSYWKQIHCHDHDGLSILTPTLCTWIYDKYWLSLTQTPHICMFMICTQTDLDTCMYISILHFFYDQWYLRQYLNRSIYAMHFKRYTSNSSDHYLLVPSGLHTHVYVYVYIFKAAYHSMIVRNIIPNIGINNWHG